MNTLENLDSLNAQDLRTLVSTAVQLLAAESMQQRADIPPELTELPVSKTAPIIFSRLSPWDSSLAESDVSAAMCDASISSQIAKYTIAELCKDSDLKTSLASAVEYRSRVMTGPESVLLVGALVILAIRVKELGVTRDGATVRFDPAHSTVQNFVKGLISMIRPGLPR